MAGDHHLADALIYFLPIAVIAYAEMGKAEAERDGDAAVMQILCLSVPILLSVVEYLLIVIPQPGVCVTPGVILKTVLHVQLPFLIQQL